MVAKKMTIKEIEKEYKTLVVDYDKSVQRLLASIKERIKEFCKCRQISSHGEGIRLDMNVEYNGLTSNLYEVSVEDDVIQLDFETFDYALTLNNFPDDIQLKICIECIRKINNDKETFKGKRGLTLYRAEYEDLPLPMTTMGVTDDEMQELCQNIEDELFASFDKDDVKIYIADKDELEHLKPFVYTDIDEAYYVALENVGLDSGVVYYSDLEDEED